MHHIDSLEISGFKSFRNKIKIQFSGGISAIVGPNGCGKSNICDAFLWVLGEQSARQLRGSRMEDVIFNGTQRHGPIGMAEVILRLKYSPITEETDCISQEDIEICRRLFRDGVSEYHLNGRRCRLLDIQETFEGTGLGFTSYAIIEQGRIHNIIASKPMEKRSLIEEAARIVSFKMRKKSAQLKLELAQQNLVRIHDLSQEIERNLKSLKVQVQRAKRYRFLRDRMRSFQRIRYYLLGKSLMVQQEELSGKIRSSEAEILQSEMDFKAATTRLDEEKTRLDIAEKALAELQEERNNVQLNLQRITTSQTFLHQQGNSLGERLAAIDQECGQLTAQIEQRRQQAAEVEKKSTLLAQAREEARVIHEERERMHQERDQLLAGRELELENLRQAVFEEAGTVSGWKNEEAKLLEHYRWAERQRKKLEEDLASFSGTLAQLETDADNDREKLESLTRELEDLEYEAEENSHRMDTLKGRQASFSRQREQLEKEASYLTHRLQSLAELEARHEFYSDTLKKLLPAISQQPSFRGMLADFLELREDAAAATEDYLQNELETIVTDSLELVGQGLAQLKQNQGGRCQFILRNSGFAGRTDAPAFPADHPGVCSRLVDGLSSDAAGRELLLRAAPGIETVWLVKDWRTAAEIALQTPGVTCLSMDGVAVSSSGRITVHAGAGHKGIFGYRREKKEIQQNLQTQQHELDVAQTTLAGLDAELEEVEYRQAEIKDGLDDSRIHKVRLQGEQKRKNDEIARHLALVKNTTAELATLRAEEEQVQTDLERIQGKIRSVEQTRLSREEEFVRCRDEISALKEESARLSKEFSDARMSFMTAKEQLQSALTELAQHRQAVGDMEHRLHLLESERAKTVQKMEHMQGELAAFDQRYQESLLHQQELEKKLESRRTVLEEHRLKIHNLAGEMEQRRDALAMVRERRNQLEIENVHLRSELSHLEEDTALEFHQTLAQLCATAEPEAGSDDAEEAHHQYLEYRDKVEKMGSVNLVAMEEYDREEERLTFHQEQERDISESIVSTQKAIEEIDSRSARLFRETFNAINTNFQEMFHYLFGGGQCELRLVDDENLMESGVDIVASPPGKKQQNILLLSGGEKALTALALLLAIFKYRPSPFCILDEVDAPLDESNIDRFVALIRTMSQQTQYILITHNKRTMEIANSIYGVTMEDPGLSKVISVQLKEAEAVLNQ